MGKVTGFLEFDRQELQSPIGAGARNGVELMRKVGRLRQIGADFQRGPFAEAVTQQVATARRLALMHENQAWPRWHQRSTGGSNLPFTLASTR